MKKKLIILIFLLSILFLISCSEKHTHSLGDYVYGSNSHWKECTTCGEKVNIESHSLTSSVTTQPTHTTKGVRTYTCSVCGYSYCEDIDKLSEHTFNQEIAESKYLKEEATCTTKAVYYKSCICGEPSTTDTFEYGELKAHNLDHHDAKSPTCTEIGWNAYDTCKNCSYTTYFELEATGHSYSDTLSNDSTGHWYQDTCGHNLKKDFESHSYTSSVTTEPTHTTKGVRTYTCSVCGYTYTEEIDKLPEHTFNQEIAESKYLKEEATCTSYATYYKSCICGEPSTTDTFEYGELKAHDLDHHDAKSPTCTEIGWNAYDTCKNCNYTTYQELDALRHDVKKVNDYCSRCGKVYIVNVSSSSSTIYFGSYPQTQVTATTENRLSSITFNSTTWTSYGYYASGSISSYMYYKDIDIDSDGEYDYRGVYFISYRPYYCGYSSSSTNSLQDNNGYNTSTIYFFKYEPVKWNILNESDGKALIVSELILDSQQFDYDGSYSNNYEASTIRAWLNDTFYNTCFNECQKAIIETTNVDNSASSTGSSSNQYACSNTNDKIFLLSCKEVTTYYQSNSSRQSKGTDYAKVQGLYVSTSSSYVGYSFWWLRSSSGFGSAYAYIVDYDGSIDDYDVENTRCGVRAACIINLSN